MPEVVMPRLDPGMQSGKIVEWLKKEGESVRKGEPILVVEGEKTTFEVEAPESGVLTQILVSVGTDVEVSRPVAIIGEPSVGSEAVSTRQRPGMQETAPHGGPAEARGERVIASPAARRLAHEHDIDLTKITGTGPGGRISREDVLAVTNRAPGEYGPPKVSQPGVLRKLRLEGIRKAVAERLGYSVRTVVPVTLTMEVDATKLVELKNRQDHIGFSAYVVRAAAMALERNQVMNSTIEGEEITTYSDINVAVAVHTEQGLVAPVIQNANKKSLKQISTEIEQLSEKAKGNRLTVEELTGGTFTITNLGPYDVESFAPVINPPQCAILGLARIAYKPYATADRVSMRPTTMLTLVFDHRIVDGVPAAKFLRDVKGNLEDAESLLP
jgi:pyruvate dehydrogenase E2 component (dihydrolipoamide acetyltransferase)